MTEYIMRYENEVLQLLPDKIQQLVRCKDCESRHENGCCYNKNVHFGMFRSPNWFCADGKRRDGEQE